jgi:hypothetical protein
MEIAVLGLQPARIAERRTATSLQGIGTSLFHFLVQ